MIHHRLTYGVGKSGYQVLEKSPDLGGESETSVVQFLKSASYGDLSSKATQSGVVVLPNVDGWIWICRESDGQTDEFQRSTRYISCIAIRQADIREDTDLAGLLPYASSMMIQGLIEHRTDKIPFALIPSGNAKQVLTETATLSEKEREMSKHSSKSSMSVRTGETARNTRSSGLLALSLFLNLLLLLALAGMEMFIHRPLRRDQEEFLKSKVLMKEHFQINQFSERDAFQEARTALEHNADARWQDALRTLPGFSQRIFSTPDDLTIGLKETLSDYENLRQQKNKIEAWVELSADKKAMAELHLFLTNHGNTLSGLYENLGTVRESLKDTSYSIASPDASVLAQPESP